MIKEMLEAGVIEPTQSDYASPVVIVLKKNGESRWCIDYRWLNDQSKKDPYPLPRIDDLLQDIGKATYFSTIDAKSGYWQILMNEEDKEKTAFTTYEGNYKYTVMPFGLCNAPATYQRMMDTAFSGLQIGRAHV